MPILTATPRPLAAIQQYSNSQMANEKGLSNNLKISNQFKYLLLIIVGLIVILFCSLFQHVTPVEVEYHYSKFMMGII